MLQVNNVNLNRYQASFKGAYDTQPEYKNYSKYDYENDKSQLEDHLDNINEVIENVNVPKPIRTFGKVISVGIGIALGFVSMKYGAQGVLKLANTGAEKVKKLSNKSFIKRIGSGIKTGAQAVWNFIKKTYNRIKNTKAVQNVSKFVSEKNAKFKNSKFYKGLTQNKVVKTISDFFKRIYNTVKGKFKSIKKPQVENAAVNFMATAGGVSGGISALSGVAAHNKNNENKIDNAEVIDD